MLNKNNKKILNQSDIAKIFGIHVRTFQKYLSIIISNNPNNPRIQRYLGKKWFLDSNDLDEFISLFSKKDQSTNQFNQSDHKACEDEKTRKEYFDEKNTFESNLDLEAEYAGDCWLELQSEIARGK